MHSPFSPLGCARIEAGASLLLRQESETRMGVQQVADICMLVYFSFDMVSHQLHEAWQPQLEHLIAPVAALHFDIGLQHRSC